MPKQKIKNDKFKIAVFPRKGVRSLYSSVETPVMGMERRGRRSSFYVKLRVDASTTAVGNQQQK